MSAQDPRIAELIELAKSEDLTLPYPPETIIRMENAGNVVNLATGVIEISGADVRYDPTAQAVIDKAGAAMTNQTFSDARKQLDKTRIRLTVLSADMYTIGGKLPKGRRTERTRQFVALTITGFISEYEQAIGELEVQCATLKAIATGLGGEQYG